MVVGWEPDQTKKKSVRYFCVRYVCVKKVSVTFVSVTFVSVTCVSVTFVSVTIRYRRRGECGGGGFKKVVGGWCC